MQKKGEKNADGIFFVIFLVFFFICLNTALINDYESCFAIYCSYSMLTNIMDCS